MSALEPEKRSPRRAALTIPVARQSPGEIQTCTSSRANLGLCQWRGASIGPLQCVASSKGPVTFCSCLIPGSLLLLRYGVTGWAAQPSFACPGKW
jgi:hypothetical protein